MSLLAPETIDVTVLPWTPIKYYEALPKCPGLYFVLNNASEICYIGRANQIKSRWYDHHRLQDFLQFDDYRIAWLEVLDITLLPSLEKACIDYFQPKHNLRVGPKPRDEVVRSAHVMLTHEQREWCKQQPEGMSRYITRLLRQDRQRRRATVSA